MNIYDAVDRYLREGKKGMLATVVNKAGAAPREAGAKMLIGEDRQFIGTIGGGKLEAEVINEALKTMDTTLTRLIHITMDAETVTSEGILCGGNVDVLLEPILARHGEVYAGGRECERKGTSAILLTRLKTLPIQKSLIGRNGVVWGDGLSEHEIAELRDFWTEKRFHFTYNETMIEPIAVSSDLYIFGAGHISQFLSKVARMVDFTVTVIDDREEFANRERFPEADHIIVEDFREVFDRLDFSRAAYIVIVTRGHNHDALVLQKSIEKPTQYIGMIGSRRKIHMVFDYLKERGVEEKILKSVHAPVGLNINSETPQEIAVSIVAELIDVRGGSR